VTTWKLSWRCSSIGSIRSPCGSLFLRDEDARIKRVERDKVKRDATKRSRDRLGISEYARRKGALVRRVEADVLPVEEAEIPYLT
jgi:hypothetical protein